VALLFAGIVFGTGVQRPVMYEYIRNLFDFVWRGGSGWKPLREILRRPEMSQSSPPSRMGRLVDEIKRAWEGAPGLHAIIIFLTPNTLRWCVEPKCLRLPGPLGVIFSIIEARRNEIRPWPEPRWQPNLMGSTIKRLEPFADYQRRMIAAIAQIQRFNRIDIGQLGNCTLVQGLAKRGGGVSAHRGGRTAGSIARWLKRFDAAEWTA